MALTLSQIASILSPVPSPTEGARTAIQGFESFGQAGARYKQGQQNDVRLQQNQQQLDEARRASMVQEAYQKALEEQRKREMRAKALSEQSQALIDPATREAALAALEQSGWQPVRPQPPPQPELQGPMGPTLPPPEGQGIGEGVDVDRGGRVSTSVRPMTEPQFDEMIGGLAETGGMVQAQPPPQPETEPQRGIMLRSPEGIEFSIDPDAKAEEIAGRVESVLSSLGQGEPRYKRVYEQVRRSAREFARAEGYDPAQAERQAVGLLEKLLSQEAARERAEMMARAQAGTRDLKREDKGFDKAVKVGDKAQVPMINEAYDSFQSVKAALSAPGARNNPNLVSGISTRLARAFGESRVTDADVRRVEGAERRSLIDSMLNEAERLLRGGNSAQAHQLTLRAAEIMEEVYKGAARAKYKRMVQFARASPGEEQGGISQYVVSMFGQYDWFEDAQKTEWRLPSIRGVGGGGGGQGIPSSAVDPNAPSLGTAPVPKLPKSMRRVR